MAFKIVCAWCGKTEEHPLPPPTVVDLVRTKVAGRETIAVPPTSLPRPLVSHTICDTCFVRERALAERIATARRRRSSA
ncbi:hypothetical protein HY251_10895 [bacterium]|nr:hypothetical protein [bacterium]